MVKERLTLKMESNDVVGYHRMVKQSGKGRLAVKMRDS